VKARDKAPRERELVQVPADAARIARRVCRVEQETFVVLCVDVRNRLIAPPFVAAIGTVHAVEVAPRDVFREAVRQNAVGLVVAHNHPTGDPTPSAEDLLLTERLKVVGEVLGIPVVDHVVIGAPGTFVSIAEWLSGKTSP
jgi:DNA repair protein RadC